MYHSLWPYMSRQHVLGVSIESTTDNAEFAGRKPSTSVIGYKRPSPGSAERDPRPPPLSKGFDVSITHIEKSGGTAWSKLEVER
mmetsp:Transcript_35272/g.85069  ORF Transcript_35272/g.85069 Transcript_35272/m.85069 type:complete len:84 (-) Transcript_35272:232-483(-)